MTASTEADESLRRVRLVAECNAAATRRHQEKLTVLRQRDRAMLATLTSCPGTLTGRSPEPVRWSR